jgi:hypothetical protein
MRMNASNDAPRALDWLDRLDWRVVFVAALALHLTALAVRSTDGSRLPEGNAS